MSLIETILCYNRLQGYLILFCNMYKSKMMIKIVQGVSES